MPREELTEAQWEQVAADIAGLVETGQRTDLLQMAALEDPARYASINAEIMAPIREAQAQRRQEQVQKAEQRRADMEARAAARAAAAEERIAKRAAELLRAGE